MCLLREMRWIVWAEKIENGTFTIESGKERT
jgi:hypothetical protein